MRPALFVAGLFLSAWLEAFGTPGVVRCGFDLTAAPQEAASAAAPSRLRVQNGGFLRADGTAFPWRGVTAFALVEQVAHGREADARASLRWARDTGFTIVRVLAMASGLFRLEPADGVRALPRLLELAEELGLAVEVVALADTAAYPGLDLDAHVTAVGQAVVRSPNTVLELANEPYHPTQRRGLDAPALLTRLRARWSQSTQLEPESAGGWWRSV